MREQLDGFTSEPQVEEVRFSAHLCENLTSHVESSEILRE